VFSLHLKRRRSIITDIFEFYDTTVKVSRYVKVGTGTATKLESVIDSLPCMTQTDENKLIMPVAGQTAIDFRIMYSNLVDVRLKDIVEILTAPAGVNVGAKYLVVQVNDFSIPDMEHLETSLQGGVV
jgi:hypothetical protein